MRIRKHAKISPLVYAASSLKPGTILQTHVCQLNQSPWDVMSFSPPSSPPPPPPPPFQANGNDISAANGSSAKCISVVERELNTWRRSEYLNTMHKVGSPPPSPPPVKNEPVILCCKTDGKSWQCRREAARGNSLCEHHLSLVKSYNNLAHNATRKSAKAAVEAPAPAPRRARPKKASTPSSSSNPYEFYYYSGFGPRWGKRRGETCKSNGASMPKNDGDEHEHEIEPPTPEEGFDYAEYEDDDDDDEDEGSRDNGKKRVRKPIKARSLKSLM